MTSNKANSINDELGLQLTCRSIFYTKNYLPSFLKQKALMVIPIFCIVINTERFLILLIPLKANSLTVIINYLCQVPLTRRQRGKMTRHVNMRKLTLLSSEHVGPLLASDILVNGY